MYRIHYGYKHYSGSFYANMEGCSSFAEAEVAFLSQSVFQDCFIRAIEKR